MKCRRGIEQERKRVPGQMNLDAAGQFRDDKRHEKGMRPKACGYTLLGCPWDGLAN